MDPVKEKLNLLKKLANEKKSLNHGNQQIENENELEDIEAQSFNQTEEANAYHNLIYDRVENDQDDSELDEDDDDDDSNNNNAQTENLLQDSDSNTNQVITNEQDYESSNKKARTLNEPLKLAYSLSENNIELIKADNTTINTINSSIINDSECNNNNNESLFVYDDDKQEPKQNINLIESLANNENKENFSNLDNKNTNTSSAEPTSMQKGIIAKQNELLVDKKPAYKYLQNSIESSSATTPKYINRIKELYDKERSCSTESINLPISAKKNLFPLINQNLAKSPSLLKLSPQSSINNNNTNLATINSEDQDSSLQGKAPLALPEISIDGANLVDDTSQISDVDESSVFSMTSAAYNKASTKSEPIVTSSGHNRSSKYIRHLRDTFNSGRSDSIDNLKRNSFNVSFNQIDELNSLNRNVSPLPNSTSANTQVEKMKEKFSKINDTTEARKVQQTTNNRSSSIFAFENNVNKPIEPPVSNLQNLELRFPLKNEENNIELPEKRKESPKALRKYQKSKTSDLTGLIFVNNAKEDAQKDEQNSDYDMLIDKYGIDAKYSHENAIIRSTLFSHRARPNTAQQEAAQTNDNAMPMMKQENKPQKKVISLVLRELVLEGGAILVHLMYKYIASFLYKLFLKISN